VLVEIIQVKEQCLRLVCLSVVRHEKFLPKLYKMYCSTVSCRRADVKNNEKLGTTDELGDKKENMLLSD
jgi:hypothetical protein